ncbi:MAG TPA: sortase [Patescibacteria group bacterium]|nr:sortase [Patescibacteria group bacterium]
MLINFLTPEFRHKLKKHKRKEVLILKLSKMFAYLGIVFLVLSFAPSVWYSLGARVDDFSEAILKTVLQTKGDEVKPRVTEKIDWQPSYNQKLTRETRLKIPSIKVDTVVNEATVENYEEALKKGVWRIPDFGTPYNRDKPMILAAHRFGYLSWTNKFRRENSFFKLPDLKVGDFVEITYRQRKYIYEIYAESRGEEITDYSANLILYTCETLNSKIRIFKYARLLEI